jgi:hypothetical protein
MPNSRAPLLIGLTLLLLPLAYVGSYLALVQPLGGQAVWTVPNLRRIEAPFGTYRMGGRYAEIFYWPLEQIDRKIRTDWQFNDVQ